MLKVLLVSQDNASLSGLKAGLEENEVQTVRAQSGSYALSKIAEKDFDLVIADENLGDMTGLEFIRTVVVQKPMVNCAAVSSLLPDEFHEASEGLGVLMQLPVNPGYECAEELLEHLGKILNLAVDSE